MSTSSGAEPRVRITALSKLFRRANGDLVRAVDDVSLDVADGEFLVLLGPSGCGKTTLLRCIAGVERPDAGVIQIGGKTVYSASAKTFAPPEHRRIGMMFQSFALWPHMTAFQNVAYPLQVRKVAKAEIGRRVRERLELVGIPQLEGQYPGQMSGGQQQRLALARAIVAGDDVILFDEPLSNVDAKVREQLRLELLTVQRELGFTAIYVTHDQTEAMELATRIAVLRDGKISQLGSPRDIYERPATRYVARFVGTTNELSGRLLNLNGKTATVQTVVGDVDAAKGGTCGVAVGDDIVVVSRPERWEIADAADADDSWWKATVETSHFVGPYTDTVVRLGESATVRIWSPGATQVWAPGSAVRVAARPDALMVLDPAEG